MVNKVLRIFKKGAAILCATSLFIISGNFEAAAQAGNKSDIMAKIAKTNATYKTVIAPFTQVKSMKGVKKDIVNQGTLYFNRATNQLNMQYSKPAKNQTLITGDKLILITGGTRESYNTKTDPSMSTLKWTLLYCIGGEIEKAAKENSATINLLSTDKYYTFELLIGKQIKGGWAKLELSYSKTDHTLCIMKMIEKNGNSVTYNTPQKELNAALEAGIFNN